LAAMQGIQPLSPYRRICPLLPCFWGQFHQCASQY